MIWNSADFWDASPRKGESDRGLEQSGNIYCVSRDGIGDVGCLVQELNRTSGRTQRRDCGKAYVERG